MIQLKLKKKKKKGKKQKKKTEKKVEKQPKKQEEKNPEEKANKYSKRQEEKKPEDRKPKDKKIEDKKPVEKEPEEKKKEEKPKMVEKRIEVETKLNFDLNINTFDTSKDVLDKYIQREKNQAKEDEILHEASNLKNSLEQYIYSTKEKFDHELKGYYTNKEKTDLIKLMDALMTWLYSEDEKLYDKPTLLENSKNMTKLGDSIYKRCEDWTNLINNYNIFESVVNQITARIK